MSLFHNSGDFYVSNARRTQRLLILTLLLASRLAAQSVRERAGGELRDGHATAAANHLRASLAKNPHDARVWNLLGIAEAEQSHAQEAETAFRHALRLNGHLLPANENLGLLLFRRANYAGAGSYLQTAIRDGSVNPAVRFNLAVALLRSGQPAFARQQFVALESGSHSSADYWEERGTADLALKDPSAAAVSFDRALELAPTDVRALNGAALAAEVMHQLDKAVALMVRARQAAPTDVTTLVNFGRICLERDLDNDALDALTNAYAAAPQRNEALYLLAGAHLALEHYARARELLVEYARRAPDYATTYYAMGWIDNKLSNSKLAREEFTRSLKLNPNFENALYELAALDLDETRLDAAEAGFRRVLALKPVHAKAAAGLGDVLAKRGNTDQAERFYEQALRALPNWGAAHYKLAMLLFRKHDNDRAERERTLAAELNRKEYLEGRTRLKIITADAPDNGLAIEKNDNRGKESSSRTKRVR